MQVPTPPVQWPSEFIAEGPVQDPTILLTGRAEIGNAAYRIQAVRMRKGMRSPDYRSDVPQSAYNESLDRVVDDVQDIIESLSPQLVQIGEGHYLLWLVPDVWQ